MILKSDLIIGGGIFLKHLSFQKNCTTAKKKKKKKSVKTKNQLKFRETRQERLPGARPEAGGRSCALPLKSLRRMRDRLVAAPPP